MKELDEGENKERGEARLVRPNRSQLTWDLFDRDAWLPTDHLARLVWAFVVGLDLARLYDKACPRRGDGAIRSAYNVQLAVTSDHGFITAVQATERRNDNGLARPMLEESERRTGAYVKRLLADAGYA